MGRRRERVLANPVHQQMALVLYRAHATDKEVAHALGVGLPTLRKELALDAQFAAAVQDAKAGAFQPVIRHAIDLAMQADALGKNEGATKALDMVMKYYSRVLDREHQEALLDRKIEAAAQGIHPEGQSQMPLLVTPEAAVAFAQQLTAGPPIEVTEAETVEED